MSEGNHNHHPQTNPLIGLSSEEVILRFEKYGENIIKEKNNNPIWKIFLSQFQSALVVVLLIATGVSASIGEVTDAAIIFAVVILNAIFGFIQEYKADKAIQSLKKIAGLKTKVLRDGIEQIIDACGLTIGDIILIDTGDKIPADARLLEDINLEIQESILTGESLPVQKKTNGIRNDIIYSGTIVTKGRGKAIVTAIGMNTEIGKIAEMIQETPDKDTNLEKKINGLSKGLGAITLIICLVLFLTYFFIREFELHEAFITAVAIAVAAIPEGLPAVVTISLSLGVKRFIKKNVLVRKLSSVETLGAVNVICTDKTGTLTKNEMTVTKLFVNNEVVEISGNGYLIKGVFYKDSQNFKKLLEIGLLCNNSKLENGNSIGDPTELALIVTAKKGGITQESFFNKHIRTNEFSFDSERKMMSSVYKNIDNGDFVTYTKGAIENILPKCNRILLNGDVKHLDEIDKELILKESGKFSEEALRVLGFAYGNKNKEEDLIFVGLQAMIDPPRDEVKEAIEKCKTAGIRIIMITGDNFITAKAIAKQIGIDGEVITGEEFENSHNKLDLINKIGIFARVNPAHKQTIVKLLQSQGNIVAMTGDGINDAPALKMSDIGIGMGISGTDVTKEAADMVLMDDNFTSIVNAIQEGRGIYDNIQKFVTYLLASNIGELLILFIASLIGIPLPLLAIHLLRINLVTDGLPAIALGIDPINPNVMERRPLKKEQSIIGLKMITNIIILSSIMTIGGIFLFFKYHDLDLDMARSGVFILLVFIELIKIQIIRSQYGLGLFSNKRLIVAVNISIALVLAIIYIPVLSSLFKVKPVSLEIWMDIRIVIGILLIIGGILGKVLGRERKILNV